MFLFNLFLHAIKNIVINFYAQCINFDANDAMNDLELIVKTRRQKKCQKIEA